MNKKKNLTGLLFRTGGILFVILGMASADAATFWTGPNTNWNKAVTPTDVILPGKVVLTRGGSRALYNTVTEGFSGFGSPAGTEWAFGNFTNHTPFQSMDSMRNGDLRSLILNQPMVLHLIAD